MSGGADILGRLPNRQAELVLVSGEYPELAERLRGLGIGVVVTMADKCLPGPVQWHPDMQACAIGSRMVVLRNSGLLDVLAKRGISASETFDAPEPVYPKDVLCNVLAWDKWVLGNLQTADTAVRWAAEKLGITWIDVKQGYAACATVLVDTQSAITADNGIAGQLKRHGIDVLRISAGTVKLPGYPYGFIGGCCGKVAPGIMAFAGSLDSHPDGERIRNFLSLHGVEPVELFCDELLDVGGLMALY